MKSCRAVSMKTVRCICNYLLLLSLLLAIGYGVSKIHGDFFRTMDDGFYRLGVSPERGEDSPLSEGEVVFQEGSPVMFKQVALSQAALKSMNDWAEKEDALLLISDSSKQILFADTPHGRTMLRLKKTGDSDSGLYLAEQLLSDDYYVQAGLFLPSSVKYEIEGSADLSRIPKLWAGNQDYWLFPINRYEGDLQEEFFVVLTDSSRFEELKTILTQEGFYADSSLSAKTSFSDFIKKLRANLYSYSSFLLLFLSLCLSFILIYVSWWRGRREAEAIRHLFGKSRRKTIGQLVLSTLLLWGTASLIWTLLFRKLWFYYSTNGKWEVCIGSAAIFLLLSILAALLSGIAVLKPAEG